MQKPVRINYLGMIWSVKIILAKIKEGKGNDFKLSTKKSLASKIPPKM